MSVEQVVGLRLCIKFKCGGGVIVGSPAGIQEPRLRLFSD